MKSEVLIGLDSQCCRLFKKNLLIACLILIFSPLTKAQTDGSNLKPDLSWKKKKYGFVDKATGQLVIPYKFDRVEEFDQGLAIAVKGSCGLINAEGKEVLPFEYLGIYRVKCPNILYVLAVQDKTKSPFSVDPNLSGLADSTGRIILPCEYSNFKSVGNLFTFKKRLNENSTGLGIINNKGQIIVPPSAENYPEPTFTNVAERVAYEKDGVLKYGAIGKSGEVVIPFEYKNLFINSDLIVATDFNSKCHLFSLSGKILSNEVYDEYTNKGATTELSDNAVKLKKEGKWGFFNKNGMIVPCEYDIIPDDFRYGFISVLINNRFGLVNRQGKCVVPCMYDIAFYYEKAKYLFVRKDKFTGYYSLDGKIILPCEFSSLPESSVNGSFIFRKDNKIGMVDTTGVQKVPFVLDEKFAESNPNQAISYCETILKTDPQNSEVINLLAYTWYVSRKPEDALSGLTNLAGIYHKPGIYYYKALVNLKLGDLKKAGDDCANTTYPASEGWSCKAYTALANEKFKKGMYNEALTNCMSAKTNIAYCAEAVQLEKAIRSEMKQKGIKEEERLTLNLGKVEPKREIYFIGDDRKTFPANWPESFYWNPAGQLTGNYTGSYCDCKMTDLNVNNYGHNKNYLSMECAKYVTYKTLLEKNVVKKETGATYFIKSIEYKDNQYIFYTEEGDGPITYKNGMNIYYSKTDNTVSFTITIDNMTQEMKMNKKTY
jgi:tetratricopeptide (TPR) repeat protein